MEHRWTVVKDRLGNDVLMRNGISWAMSGKTGMMDLIADSLNRLDPAPDLMCSDCGSSEIVRTREIFHCNNCGFERSNAEPPQLRRVV